MNGGAGLVGGSVRVRELRSVPETEKASVALGCGDGVGVIDRQRQAAGHEVTAQRGRDSYTAA